MAAGWAVAFVAAAAVALVGTPLLRRAALATGFVDAPSPRKSHHRPVPYLGGIGIIAGALVGVLAGTGIASRFVVVALAAVVVALTGLVDDRRVMGAWSRLSVQLVATVAVVLAGIRVHATDVDAADAVLAMVWIVGLTNAFNLLDNMDGLSAGTATVVSAAVFSLAGFGQQRVVAGLAAGLLGGCLGFLAYNIRPAAIFMGDAGSLFLGFVLAVAVLELDPVLTPPASFAVPLMLMALPILDTTVVTVARLRRRRPVMAGAKDHLSHRLVAMGLSPGTAVLTLLGIEAAVAAVAVFAGRGVLDVLPASLIVLGLSAALLAVTAEANVYRSRGRGFSVRVYAGAALVLVALGVLAGPAAFALLRARSSLELGAADAQAGVAAVRQGDRASAMAAFDRAHTYLARARSRLDGPLVSAGLTVPVLASNLKAARLLAGTGTDAAAVSRQLAADVDPERLRVRGGQVPVDEVRRVAGRLKVGAAELRRASTAVARQPRSYLLPPVRDALGRLDDKLSTAAEDAARAAAAAAVAPDLLGADGPRRYFLAVQNNAELRASGGFIGNYGEIVAEAGRLRFERFGRISELNPTGPGERTLTADAEFRARYDRFDLGRTWQNVNMSPDFPTVARVIADLYPQSGGRPVDGVVAIDPVGLAAILEVTGPITVPPWPEPLSAQNVVDVTLRDAYSRLPQPVRVDFLGQVASAAWSKLFAADLPAPGRLAAVLGGAAGRGHLLFHAFGDDSAAALDRLDVNGRVSRRAPDSVLVINQNAAGNKTDYYLRRHLDLTVALRPRGEREGRPGRPPEPTVAGVTTQAAVRLVNGAPASGLPFEVIGPYSKEFQPGENRTFFSVYTPHALAGARIDGTQQGLESGTEAGHNVFSTFVSIPSGAERSVEVDLSGTTSLAPGGWYELALGHQPVLTPDRTKVAVTVPAGWRITDARGLRVTRHRRAEAEFDQVRDRTLAVRLEPEPPTDLWGRLRAGE